MKNDHMHKSSLFLIELIIAIAFFTIASAVCIQLFVKSHLLGNETRELNAAVNLATSAAESFRQCDGSLENFQNILPQLILEGDSSMASYYDANFQTCEKKNAIYTMQIVMESNMQFSSAQITIKDIQEQENIYELDVQTYLKNTI